MRDFWRFWGYPDAFKSATGVALSRLVLPIEHSMLDEEQTTYKPSSKIEIIYPGVISNKRSENFFGFFSEDVETNSPTLLAEREAESWGLKQVQDVLTRHLGSDADYVPSRIVFEALFNASKHPKATLLQSASWHQKFSEKVDGSFGDKDGFFTLMFWDNGKSILSTLTDAVKDGVDLREGYEGGYDKNYYIREKHLVSDLVSNDETINSADIGFDLDAPERLLVSALFPGVTSRPESIDPVEHSFSKHLAKVDVNLTKRGMGLYVLMNAVVDVLGGSVEFRTDRFHIRAKRLGPRNAKSHGADTKITVTRVPDVLPKFIGNLIVVRAPSKN